jgi:hypothetical protein
MSNLDMWFGTKGYMQWVPCPLVDSDMSAIGWQSEAQYLNGGARVRRSNTGHKEYNLAWGLQARDHIRLITDYADGVYGDGLIYFIDPFAMDKNILPSYWAAPMLNAYDGPILSGGTRPQITTTSANSFMHPAKTAIYSVATVDAQTRSILYIPIPPGYVFWFGAKGSSSGANVYIDAELISGGTSPSTATLSSSLDNVQVSQSWSSATYSGVNISLTGNGTINLTSMCAQILPIGVDPVNSNFISGQGNSGCSFAEFPKLQNYSSAMDKAGLTARLVEVGAWL